MTAPGKGRKPPKALETKLASEKKRGNLIICSFFDTRRRERTGSGQGDGVFEELINLSFYLAENDEDIAQKFLNACDNTFKFLAKNRFIGSVKDFKNTNLSEIRMWRIKGFEKYLIFYKPLDNGVKILHVLHSVTDYNRAFESD